MLRRVLVGAGFALVLAGCSNNSGPKDYDAAVEDNFVTSCTSANPEKKDVPDTAVFCGCVYSEIKSKYTFDQFKVLDAKLRDAMADEKTAPKTPADLTKLDTDFVKVVETCRLSGPSTPTTTTAATAASTTTTAAK